MAGKDIQQAYIAERLMGANYKELFDLANAVGYELQSITPKGPHDINVMIDYSKNMKSDNPAVLGVMLATARLELEKPLQTDEQLTFERMKMEIVAAMMKTLLTQRMKIPKNILQDYAVIINHFGGDFEKQKLIELGLAPSMQDETVAVISNFASFIGFRAQTPAQTNKREILDAYAKHLIDALNQPPIKHENLADAIESLKKESAAIAIIREKDDPAELNDLIKAAQMLNDVSKKISIKSILGLAAEINVIEVYLERLRQDLNNHSEIATGSKLNLLRAMQDIKENIADARKVLTARMKEHLSYIDDKAIQTLSAERNETYRYDPKFAQMRKSALEQGNMTKVSVIDEAVKKADSNKLFTMTDQDIIKFLSYISRYGSVAEKAELHSMQPATFFASDNKEWLNQFLLEWDIKLDTKVIDALSDLQANHQLFITVGDKEIVHNIVSAFQEETNQEQLANLLIAANDSNIVSNLQEFALYFQFAGLLRKHYNSSDTGFISDLKELLLVSNNMKDLSEKFSTLDKGQAILFKSFLHNHFISSEKELNFVFSVIAKCREPWREERIELISTLIEKFSHDDRDDLVEAIKQCAKTKDPLAAYRILRDAKDLKSALQELNPPKIEVPVATVGLFAHSPQQKNLPLAPQQENLPHARYLLNLVTTAVATHKDLEGNGKTKYFEDLVRLQNSIAEIIIDGADKNNDKETTNKILDSIRRDLLGSIEDTIKFARKPSATNSDPFSSPKADKFFTRLVRQKKSPHHSKLLIAILAIYDGLPNKYETAPPFKRNETINSIVSGYSNFEKVPPPETAPQLGIISKV